MRGGAKVTIEPHRHEGTVKSVLLSIRCLLIEMKVDATFVK